VQARATQRYRGRQRGKYAVLAAELRRILGGSSTGGLPNGRGVAAAGLLPEI